MSERTTTGDGPSFAGPESVGLPAVPGYEILAELGRGGMGVVYKSRQRDNGRVIALKLLRDGALAGPLERARFRTEAAAAARLRHPNIVEVYDAGDHYGQPHIAMELLEGGSLDEQVAGQPQDVRHSAELVRTLALAVQHAHDHGVIHRDLKPANVLLARIEDRGLRIEESTRSSPLDPRSYLPKISDFGLAKQLDSDSTAWTKDGAVLGTAGYMAPEQAAGRVHDMTSSVDVWSLGAILYELLVGRPPFRGDTFGETVHQVLHDEPALPSQLRPDVPTDLETVCLKCLEKQPGRRYDSAAALADDLDRFLDGRPVAAAPVGERERLARLAARDGYDVIDKVGRGPCGVVYRATHGPLKQNVALKIFPPGLVSRAGWDSRLKQSSTLWSALAHPQVVTVHGAGWLDGAPYLALEYVPHGNLADRLTGRPQPVVAALRLVAQLAEIVCYLHRQGVVHGNLKPSNVLFAADGIPRVTDFHPPVGVLAGVLPDGDAASGDLAYTAFETLRDPSADPRPHTDVYALGAILYAVLTGRPPFTSSSARDAREWIRTQDPQPPSQLNPEVTPPVEFVCLRCLRKDPWRRYVRAYDFLTRLRGLLDEPEGRAADKRRGGRQGSGEK